MKKFTILMIALVFVACSTTSEEPIAVDTTTTTEAPATTIQQADESTTTTEPTIEYVFDVEKMSPFTGKELPPETWLKRPKRVIAFKIDNNCLLYTSPSPRDAHESRMPSSA